MILKSDKLAERLTQGANLANPDPLVITPSVDPAELAASGAGSIDLRLGTWFMTLRQARMGCLEIDQPGGQTKLTKSHFVPFGDEYYLHPRNFVLAVTLEWIRLPRDLAAYVIGKSTWGRRGLIIATATGVHPGFKGCLTLELSNVGEIPIAVKPGISICQLFIHRLEVSDIDAVDRSNFVGLRRPVFRKIELDEYARKLSNAYSGPTAGT